MKTKTKKKGYRLCEYCKRVIAPSYDLDEHKKLCRSVDRYFRPK